MKKRIVALLALLSLLVLCHLRNFNIGYDSMPNILLYIVDAIWLFALVLHFVLWKKEKANENSNR